MTVFHDARDIERHLTVIALQLDAPEGAQITHARWLYGKLKSELIESGIRASWLANAGEVHQTMQGWEPDGLEYLTATVMLSINNLQWSLGPAADGEDRQFRKRLFSRIARECLAYLRAAELRAVKPIAVYGVKAKKGNMSRTKKMRDNREARAYAAKTDHGLICARYAELAAAGIKGKRKTVAKEFDLSESRIAAIWAKRDITKYPD